MIFLKKKKAISISDTIANAKYILLLNVSSASKANLAASKNICYSYKNNTKKIKDLMKIMKRV